MIGIEDQYIDILIFIIVSIVSVVAFYAFELEIRVFGLWIFLELMTALVLYSGAAMITKPEEAVHERERIVPPGPLSWIDERYDTDSQLSLPLLPSIYIRNFRFVLPSLLFWLIPVLGVGGALVVEGWGFGRRDGGSVVRLFQQLVLFERPLVAGIGLLIVSVQIVRFYRCHISTGQYRRWTTHMMLELQGKYLLFYVAGVILFVLYAMVALVVTGVGVAPVVGDSVGRMIWTAIIIVSGLLVKIGFEWSRVQGERQLSTTADGFRANFIPTPPASAEASLGSSSEDVADS